MDHENQLFNFIQAALTATLGENAAAQPADDITQPPFVHQTPAAGPQVQHSTDVQMHIVQDDDMPALQDVSDSSDSEFDDDSDIDALEVEMQAVVDTDDMPPLETPETFEGTWNVNVSESSRTNGQRRARVEEDDDSERDRRHPAERVSSAPSSASSTNSASRPSSTTTLPHNYAHTPSAPTPTPQAQPRTTTVHHIFHATMNMPRRGGAPNANANATPFRFFQHMMANANNNLNNPMNNPPNPDNTADNNAANQGPNTQAPQPPQPGRGPIPLFGGMAVSFDFGDGFEAVQMPFPVDVPMPQLPNDAPQGDNADAQPQAQAPPNRPQVPNNLGDLFATIGLNVGQMMGGIGPNGIPINIAGFGFGADNEKEDPERAKRLVEGLEDVPIGLVKRLIRVGGTGGGMGEDETKGGDAGCAICWDSLLDAEGGGFGKEKEVVEEIPSSSEGDETKAQPRIIALPCAHVFHADCLIPWFSRPRQTTCPTCRFNIDPDNLTYVSWRRRQRERQEAEAAARAADPNAPQDQPPAAASNVPNAEHPNVPFPEALMADLGDGGRITMDMFFDDDDRAESDPGLPADLPPHAAQAPEGQTAQESQENSRILRQQHQVAVRMLADVLSMRNRDTQSAGNNPTNNANANANSDEANAEALPPREPAADAAPPQTEQPAPQGPQQQRLPPFPPNLFGNGIHLASGSGRTFSEAFQQLFARFPRPPQQEPSGEQAPQPQPQPQPGVQQEQQDAAAPALNAQAPPPFNFFGAQGDFRMPGLNPANPATFADYLFGGGERPERPKRAWVLPSAPGPTLRQRIERRERDAGLRCYDVSCGIGPSDEDPELSAPLTAMKQLSIKGADGAEVCAHRFHGACLVSAERVAMRGVDVIEENGSVEVSCPVCRGAGSVTKEEWQEGVVALE